MKRILSTTLLVGVLGASPDVNADPPVRHCKHSGSSSALSQTVLAGTSAMPRDHIEQLRSGPLKGTRTPPGKTGHYGHGEALVNAPADIVLLQTLDYNQYKDLNPWRFKTSHVVGKDGDALEVYFQVSALKGLLTLWQVLRFAPPVQTEAGVAHVEGTFVRGNVEDANLIFDIHRIDDNTTVISADLLIDLSIPVPQEELDKELAESVGGAVRGLRDKSESMARARAEAAKKPQ